MKNKSFLIVINNLNFGGAEKLVLEQVNYMYKSGIKVDLLLLLKSKRKNFEEKLLLPKNNIYT